MTVVDEIRMRLQDDPELLVILPGGFWGDPLDPEPESPTSVAWQPHPETGVHHLLPSGVLLEPQVVDHPSGYRMERSQAYDQYPDLYIYAEDPDKDAALEQADLRAIQILHMTEVGTATIEATGYRSAPAVADELPGKVWYIIRRYRIQGIRHL